MMKMSKRKTLLVLALLAAGSGVAHATGPYSKVVRATDNAVFATQSGVKITLTPRTDLMAGAIKLKSILGHVEIVSTSPSDIVVHRWSPGSGIHPDKQDYSIMTFSGKNDPNHKLLAEFDKGSGIGKDGTDWLTGFDGEKGKFYSDIISTTNQVVDVDTYTMSVDAAVWSN